MKERYFKFAKEAAEKADYTGSRPTAPAVGCIIEYKGYIAAEGYNTNKTSTLQAKYNKYRYDDDSTAHKAHAEAIAAQKLRWKFGDSLDWSKAHFYLYREHRDGSLALSRPCPSCMALLSALGCKSVCYSTDNGYAEEKFK